jgi:hypothetical protein
VTIITVIRAARRPRASTMPFQRLGCGTEQFRRVEPIFADTSLYVATRARFVPRPTVHGVLVGINKGEASMRSQQCKIREGFVHTPAACRLPNAKPRKWQLAVQIPLPLPKPRSTRRGHEPATSQQGGWR